MQTTIQIKNHVIHAEWSGGPYIELRADGWSGSAKEVINVWDYEKAEARIHFDRDSMRKEIYRWMNSYGDNGEADLVHDIENNWRFM